MYCDGTTTRRRKRQSYQRSEASASVKKRPCRKRQIFTFHTIAFIRPFRSMRQRVFSGSLLVLAASAMAFSATSNTCSSEVFSAAVVDSVKDQFEGFVAAPEISKRMALTSSSNLLQANSKMVRIYARSCCLYPVKTMCKGENAQIEHRADPVSLCISRSGKSRLTRRARLLVRVPNYRAAKWWRKTRGNLVPFVLLSVDPVSSVVHSNGVNVFNRKPFVLINAIRGFHSAG